MNLSITLEQPSKKLALFGSADRHLRLIRDAFGIQIVNREDELRLAGETESISKAAKVLDQLQRKLRRQDWLTTQEVEQAIQFGRRCVRPGMGTSERIDTFAKGRGGEALKPPGQSKYLQAAMAEHDLTICCRSGRAPAKRILAVAAAASLLKRGQAKAVIIGQARG